MEKEEINNKLEQYTDNYRFWTSNAIKQLGYSINIFTTVGIAFISYLISQRIAFGPFCNNDKANIPLIIYMLSLVIIFISTSFGFFSILSRLYDFRLTRHLSLVRKKYLSNEGKLLSDKTVDYSRYCKWKVFFKYIFKKIDFINDDDFKSKTVPTKFLSLRIDTILLGIFTWSSHRFQIASFIFGIMLFCLSKLI